mmetsp:Transcript_11303/g.32569  ORF Transcript_11303/g.32569 Transcript_11303/m.32569 type:complete len:202 (-) Transcript_11303:230-835(-)
MNHSTLVGNVHIGTDEGLPPDGLSKDLDAQNVRDDLFRFPIRVWMYESDVIVGTNNVTESRQSFLDALDHDLVGQRVSEVLQFLVRGGVGDQQSPDVSHRGSSHVSSSPDGGVNHGDVFDQLGFEGRVEILRASDSGEGVRICEGAEYPDLGGIFECTTGCHVFDSGKYMCFWRIWIFGWLDGFRRFVSSRLDVQLMNSMR